MKHIQKHHFLGGAAVVVGAGVLVILAQYLVVISVDRPINQTTLPRAPVVDTYVSAVNYEEAVIAAVEKVSPAVVSITISKNVPIIESCPYNPFGDLPPEFQRFFGGGFQFSQPCQKGTRMQDVGGGSGFIVSADGLIVTNKHVVEDEEASYTVFTNDGKKYTAEVLARDPIQDIAIIKIEGKNFPSVALGNSDTVRLGQTVITIGNALAEFRNTVSVGIISGLSRTVTASTRGFDTERLEGVIQTDAAINPGNSGGPMINLRGEVIGVNTAMAGGAQNIGFALPINSVKRDISSVKSGGKITVPYLGVRYVMLTEEIAERDGISVTEGALVRGGEDGPAIVRNSPADKAGLMAEDVITAVDGVQITSERSLASLIQRRSVGDTLTLTIRRGEQTLSLRVTLEEREDN